MPTNLTQSALGKLSKDELINLVLDSADVKSELKEITNSLNNLTSKMAAMEASNKLLKDENIALSKRLRNTESQLTNTSQYTRRHLLEISTSATALHEGTNLKPNVAKLLSTTGVQVHPTDIDVAHSLGKDKKKIIFSMKSRDQRYAVLQARKTLKNKKDPTYGSVFINESMCPQYQRLDYLLRKLRKAGHIHSSWFWNGRLAFKKTEQGDRISVTHDLDISEKLPEDGAIQSILFD